MAHLNEDHPHGLQFDLDAMRAQLMARRRALGLLGLGGGAALLAGCGGGGSSSGGATVAAAASSSTASSGATTSSTTNATGSGSTGATTTTAASGSCVADPQATPGPYPADGSNTSNGATSDILTASGIVRGDIRSSFISSTTIAPGLPLSIVLNLVNSNASCAPLAGYAIYVWHCDENGDYSLYSAPAESYLRGVQVADTNGQVAFKSIYPACYSGRWPHIHFEVYKDLSTASTYRDALLTSQIAMPQAISSSVYASVAGYTGSSGNLQKVSLSTDLVFATFSTAQLAQATPTTTGDTTNGYTATVTIALGV